MVHGVRSISRNELGEATTACFCCKQVNTSVLVPHAAHWLLFVGHELPLSAIDRSAWILRVSIRSHLPTSELACQRSDDLPPTAKMFLHHFSSWRSFLHIFIIDYSSYMRIVVTGMGVVSPIGIGTDEFWTCGDQRCQWYPAGNFKLRCLQSALAGCGRSERI